MRVAHGRFQPICAGVLISDRRQVLLALGTMDRWSASREGLAVPVTGVGGGQQFEESMACCARREAFEEIGCEVSLISAASTFVEVRAGPIQILKCGDSPAPVLYQVQERPSSEPYAPGLPAGPELHIGIFHAVASGQPRPCDVPALLWAPVEALSRLRSGADWKALRDCGAELLLRNGVDLPETTRFVIPQDSTERMLLDVLDRYPMDVVFP